MPHELPHTYPNHQVERPTLDRAVLAVGPTYALIPEASQFRQATRIARRNLGRQTIARQGSYNHEEGGLLGGETVLLRGEVLAETIYDANKVTVVDRLRPGSLGKSIRQYKRSRREGAEKFYDRHARNILNLATYPQVSTDVKEMVKGLVPELWGADDSLPDDLLFSQAVSVVSRYQEEVDWKRREIMSYIPQWQHEAFLTLRRLGVDGTALEAAQQRLESSQVQFIAPIEYYSRRVNQPEGSIQYIAGDCHPDTGVKRLVINKAHVEDYESTTKHEAFHVMSAHSPKYIYRNGGELRETRIGLRLSTHDRRTGDNKIRYAWLNEGITELLTQESSKIELRYYPHEVELMTEIRKHMPLNLILNAYMEPVEPSLPASQRSPHMKKMVKTFNEVFGAGSLKLIDDFITRYGGTQQGTAKFMKVYGKILRDYPDDLARVMKPRPIDQQG